MEQVETEIENAKVPLKTVVIICFTLVSWFGSMATLYFTMKGNVDSANQCAAEAVKVANETKARVDKFNPDVIVYEVTEMQSQIKQSLIKEDEILALLHSRH